MSKLDKVYKMLKYLERGYHLEVDGRCYGMTEDLQMFILCYDITTDKPDPDRILGMPDMSLEYLSHLTDKITEDQWITMSINAALTEVNRNARKNRV